MRTLDLDPQQPPPQQPPPPQPPPRKSETKDKAKILGDCLAKSIADHFGLTAAAAASGLLAIPIPKTLVPPFRAIGVTKTTNLLSVVGHYVELTVPRLAVAGRTSGNLLRLAGRLNPYLAIGLAAIDVAAISNDTYDCYQRQISR